MQMRTVLRFGCILLTILGLGISSYAQTDTATLAGRVTDQTGAVIPGVQVEITNMDTNISVATETDEGGFYAVSNLRPGRYVIVLRKTGFKEVVKPEVVLHVQDAIVRNFGLEVGSVAESVTVLGEAGVTSTSPAVSTVVNRQFVENLPINGRSFHTLLELTPGVVLTVATQSSEGQFSVNGQRPNANYFMVDGVSANFGSNADFFMDQQAGGSVPAFGAFGGTSNLVSIDALEEFRIQTSTYAPEFGRTPGAQVSVVTRSGTNDFHGTVFEYFRNEALDATDWFVNSNNLEKPALRMNDFGGVFGGPLVKDRTFFFFSYEGVRLRAPKTDVSEVPSVSARQLAPTQTRPLLDVYPIPNGPALSSLTNEFNGAYSVPASSDAYSIRLDHSMGKGRFFGRYNHAPSQSSSILRGGFNENLGEFKTQTLTGGATLTFTPNIINDFRGNWSRNRASSFGRIRDFAGAIPPADSAVYPSFTSSQESGLFVLFLGLPAYILGQQVTNLQRQFNLIDTLSIARGSHQVKLGVDYRRLSPEFGVRPYNTTLIYFGVSQALTGTPFLVAINARETELNYGFDNLSLFAQDTWNVTSRFTLTYGLRWEYNPPPSEKDGKLPFTVLGLDDPATMILAPQGAPLWNSTTNNFAPRIGVAYNLSQKLGLVLRGGTGLFYDLGNGSALLGAGSWPYSRNKNLFFVPWPLDNASAQPPPFTLNLPAGELSVADPDLELPYSIQWNLTLEKSLGSNQALSVANVGQVGRRLLRREALLGANPNFNSLVVTRNAASSDYHALQVQFKRRPSRGLQALVSYTWSHSTDDFSNDQFRDVPSSLFDLDEIRHGSSDFDVRQSFSAAVTYDFPTPAANNVARAVLGHWSVDTIIRAHTGKPLDVFSGFAAFDVLRRPDLVPGEPIWISDPTVPKGRRINEDAFLFPPASQFGTLGRNALRGFSVSQVDFSIRRRFNLGERAKLMFRAELFNVFNHPNFADPITELFAGTFGRSTQMLASGLGSGGISGGLNPLFQIGGPRAMQFALKLSF